MEPPVKPRPVATLGPSSSSVALPENSSGEEEEDQPVLINGCCPEIFSEIQLPLLCSDETCLETSLRLAALPDAENGGGTIQSSKEQCLTANVSAEMLVQETENNGVNKKPLRRSARLVKATGNAVSGGSMKKFHNCGMIYDGNRLRRSPRFTTAPENDGNKQLRSVEESRNSGARESLRKEDMGIFNVKNVRRSARFSASSTDVGHIKPYTTFTGLSDSSYERPSKKIKMEVQNMSTKKLNVKQSSRTIASLLASSQGSDVQEKIQNVVIFEEQNGTENSSFFVGDPISSEEAQERWRWRYEMKNQRSGREIVSSDDDDEDKIVWNVQCHYTQAEIDGCIFNLGDCAHIEGEGTQKHVGRIVEFFRTTDGEDYFRVQWFYRAEDTVIKQEDTFLDKKRLFYSTVMNDNPIDCIISKVSVTQMLPRVGLKSTCIRSDYYFDMEYCVGYSTFRTLQNNKPFKRHDSSSASYTRSVSAMASTSSLHETCKAELALLDLYSGCGGMSTGLCLGAKVSGIDLVTRWSVDSDRAACESLKLNHPETHVRNDSAEDFLQLLKEWEKLCKRYVPRDMTGRIQSRSMSFRKEEDAFGDDDLAPGEFEVGRLVDICYGSPNKKGKRGLNFKVHWKGYSDEEDTWESIDGLSNCQEQICDFVRNGFKSKILPLPGDIDVICGGPPCQGISGYNRYRSIDCPWDDERNRQIGVFMDIVEFLKPKFVLMENVVDILRFDKASLARYAISRLVHMKYQARLGIMAAGCYGLPQFRMRVFLWGAHPSEKLPQFPLPTHDVIVKLWPPPEFERNTVAYDEGQPLELEKAVVLQDAISDLPAVANQESCAETSYDKPPETEFQRYIRSSKYEMTSSALNGTSRTDNSLYDHQPHTMFEDDYIRVCKIPKRKGANFRDLPGIIVGDDGVARRNPSKEKELLDSGKPLVPDYVFTFQQGKSKRPFGRIWWDETVGTVVTFPSYHSQAALHPEQDRVLTIREYARLQGFPDYYRFRGTVKERYCQVGNAVAVPVSRALGFALGIAFQKLRGDEPLLTLPWKFSLSTYLQLMQLIVLED